MKVCNLFVFANSDVVTLSGCEDVDMQEFSTKLQGLTS